MAKPAKKSAPVRGPVSAAKLRATGKQAKAAELTSASGPAAKASDSAGGANLNDAESRTKQARVLAMLRARAGATIAAMMQATGWQQHSVRGFLAGVVRKRLKLKLTSKKVDGARVYQITGGADAKAQSRQPKRPAV